MTNKTYLANEDQGIIELTREAAKALLAFAPQTKSEREYRPVLCHVFLRGDKLFTADGKSVLQIDVEQTEVAWWSGAWPLEYMQSALARTGKVRLDSKEAIDLAGPPAEQVIPERGVSLSEPIGVSTKLLARLTRAAAATGAPALKLTACAGPLSPMMWEPLGTEQLRAVIMPWGPKP